MEQNTFDRYEAQLNQSTDPYDLAEAALTTADSPEAAAARLALLLSQERQAKQRLEEAVAGHEAELERRESRSTKDELGLERKEMFNEDIETAFALFRRDPARTFAVGIWDVDNLKRVNDTMGHVVAGDRYLQRTVSAIKSRLRTGDKLYRLGGDEFVGIFHEMDDNAAKIFQERITHALEQEYEVLAQEFADDPDILEDFNTLLAKVNVPFSVSLGFSFVRPDDTPESLLNRADKAMYEQKHENKKQSEKFYPIE